jgi:helix-turn-helix protein
MLDTLDRRAEEEWRQLIIRERRNGGESFITSLDGRRYVEVKDISETLRLNPSVVERYASLDLIPGAFRSSAKGHPWRFERQALESWWAGLGTPETALNSPKVSAPAPESIETLFCSADRRRIFTAQEVADVLRTKPSRIQKLAAAGCIPGAFQLFGKPSGWRFRRKELEIWITRAIARASSIGSPLPRRRRRRN